MLPFQKTSVYVEALTTVHEILQSLEKKNTPLIKNKIEEEGMNLTTNVAKAFANPDLKEHGFHFEKAKESIHGIMALLDLSTKNSDMTAEEKEEIFKKLNDLKNNLSEFKSKQKRIMILSAELGQGHMSVSKAIKEAFEYNYGHDYNVEIIDFQEVISSFINSFTKSTYESWVKFTPGLYKLLYESTNTRVPFIKLLNQVNYPFVITKLTKFFQEKNPNLVISTYPIWSYLASEIRKKTNKNAKFVSVITDSITIHNSWVIADNDYLLVANNDTATSIHKLGVPYEKIKVLGYPVRLDFTAKPNREKFLEEIGLNPKKFTVLFLPTSQQQRKNIRIIKSLTENNKYNLVVITGRDSKLKPKLEKYGNKANIKIYGWTDQMPTFIKSCDLVITKAGGSTVMECVAAGKPMIITSIIPGQEVGNAELIHRYHLGVVAESAQKDISEDVEFIRKNYTAFTRKIAKMSKPRAALDIADFLSGLL